MRFLTSSSRAKLRLPSSYRTKKRRCHFCKEKNETNPHRAATGSVSYRQCRRGHRLLLQDSPWTAALGCRSPSPLEPNTASRRRRVWPGMGRCQEKNRDLVSFLVSRLHKESESLNHCWNSFMIPPDDSLIDSAANCFSVTIALYGFFKVTNGSGIARTSALKNWHIHPANLQQRAFFFAVSLSQRIPDAIGGRGRQSGEAAVNRTSDWESEQEEAT